MRDRAPTIPRALAKSNVKTDELNPWDLAHLCKADMEKNNIPVSFVEPDFEQAYTFEAKKKSVNSR